MMAQITDQPADDQRQGKAGRAGEKAQHSPGQQRPAVRPHKAIHDTPAGAFTTSTPVCLVSHRESPSPDSDLSLTEGAGPPKAFLVAAGCFGGLVDAIQTLSALAS
jgi:hypothetical protein